MGQKVTFEARLRVPILDQRIVIEAPVEFVWVYLTEPAHISRWNRSAKQLLVLTTRSGGIGARRRMVDGHGRGVVEEITAWMEPYGYEYRAIDGPFQAFVGRLRLQAVPSGTQVNWTADYRRRGLFGKLRDALGGRQAVRRQMADSLRALRKLIEASGVQFNPDDHQRTAMQADPGFEGRLAHAQESTKQGMAVSAQMAVENAAFTGTDQNIDDDLPPMEAIPTFVAPPALETLPPVPAQATLAPGSDVDDTKPRPPSGLRAAVATVAPVRNVPQYSSATVVPPPPAPMARTVPAGLVAPRTPDPPTQTGVPISPAQAEAGKAKPPSDARDTGEMSIWDIFGLEKPGQRSKADLDAVIADLQTPLPRPALKRSADQSPVTPTSSEPPPPIQPPSSEPMPPATPQQAFAPGFAPAAPPEPESPKRIEKASVAVRRVEAPHWQRVHVSVRDYRSGQK